MDDKITIEITVSARLLAEAEEQRRLRGETLSQFFARGAQTLLQRHKERRMLEEYVESRNRMPDESEIEEARRALENSDNA